METRIDYYALTSADNMLRAIVLLLTYGRCDFRVTPSKGDEGYSYKISLLNHRFLTYIHIGKESVLIDGKISKATNVIWYGANPQVAVNFLFELADLIRLLADDVLTAEPKKQIITIKSPIINTEPVERPKTTIFQKMRNAFKVFILLLLCTASVNAQVVDNFVTPECLLAMQVNSDTTKIDNVEFGAGSETGPDYNLCQFVFADDIFHVDKSTGQMWHYTTYSRTIHYTDCRFGFKNVATRTVGTSHKTWYEFDFLTREVRHYINGALTRTFKAEEQSETAGR